MLPNVFPGAGETPRLQHRRRLAVVLRGVARLRRDRRRFGRLARGVPGPCRDDRLAPAGHALRHRGRSGGRAAARRPAGRAADLDGRQGRRLGGDAAHRQAGGDQRALVQCAVRHGGFRDDAGRGGRLSPRRRPPLAPASAASCGATARVCTTSSTGRTGPTTASGRTRSLPSACRTARSPLSDQARVVDTCRRHLLTSYGLRSLAPGSADYHPRYEGDVRERDGGYHQGRSGGGCWAISHWRHFA